MLIYLMRHGQDDERFIGGWSDVSLIDSGKDEVLNSALWMKDNLSIKHIMCSDVKRAVETAQIVSSVLGINYQLNHNLREQNKGTLNGKLREELTDVEAKMVLEQDVDTLFPEGESLRDLYNRIKEYLSKIVEMEDDTLLITHRGVINMIYFILNNKELDIDKKQFGVSTASIHEFDVTKKMIKKVR